jgi:hypothetical protein
MKTHLIDPYRELPPPAFAFLTQALHNVEGANAFPTGTHAQAPLQDVLADLRAEAALDALDRP